MHPNVSFKVKFDRNIKHVTCTCELLKWHKLKKTKNPPSSQSIKFFFPALSCIPAPLPKSKIPAVINPQIKIIFGTTPLLHHRDTTLNYGATHFIYQLSDKPMILQHSKWKFLNGFEGKDVMVEQWVIVFRITLHSSFLDSCKRLNMCTNNKEQQMMIEKFNWKFCT